MPGRVSPVFYEQGRGGGGAPNLPHERYRYHPRLCSRPGPLEVHAPLARRFRSQSAGIGEIRRVVGEQPRTHGVKVKVPLHPAHVKTVFGWGFRSSGTTTGCTRALDSPTQLADATAEFDLSTSSP